MNEIYYDDNREAWELIIDGEWYFEGCYDECEEIYLRFAQLDV